MKTHVTFQTELFNKTEERDYFVNPDCFGDDVCKYMISKLTEKGIKCGEPCGEDWGWTFLINFNDEKFWFGTNFHGDGFWLAFIDPDKGILETLFGKQKDVPTGLANIIHKILVADSNVSDIKWFSEQEFNSGKFEDGSPSPMPS